MSVTSALYPLPLGFAESMLTGRWDSDMYAGDALVPSDDHLLSQLVHLRLMYQRSYHRYHMYARRFWAHMSIEEQLIAEANADYAESMVKDLYAMFALRVTELDAWDIGWTNAQKQPNSYWVERMRIVRKNRAIDARTLHEPDTQTVQLDRLRQRLRVIEELLPRFSQLALDETKGLVMASQPELARHTMAPNASQHRASYELWLGLLSHYQHTFCLHNDRWIQEANHAIYSGKNELKGNAGRDRFLITNANIPLPSMHTIASWVHLCAQRIIKIDDDNYIVTFTPPFIPVTKDQRSGGAGIIEDSSAAHSLPGKSSGHQRTETGAIIPGLACVQTIRFNLRTREIEYVTGEYAQDTEKDHQSYVHHLDLVSSMPGGDYGLEGFWDLKPEQAGLLQSISGQITDPWVMGSTFLPLDWIREGYALSTPWRYYAQTSHLHFRFDATDEGENALYDWSGAFMSALINYMSLSLRGRLKNDFDTAVLIESWSAPHETTVKRDGNSTRFNFKL